jgi:hypothetical protein
MESWFGSHAGSGLKQANEILEQRGEEYADSWGEPITIFLDAVLREIPEPKTVEERRLLMLASLCDVKLSRIRSGAFKADSYLDLINYVAAFVKAFEEVLPGAQFNEADEYLPVTEARRPIVAYMEHAYSDGCWCSKCQAIREDFSDAFVIKRTGV